MKILLFLALAILLGGCTQDLAPPTGDSPNPARSNDPAGTTPNTSVRASSDLSASRNPSVFSNCIGLYAQLTWPSALTPYDAPDGWPNNPAPAREILLLAGHCERMTFAESTPATNESFVLVLHTNIMPDDRPGFDSKYGSLYALAELLGSGDHTWAAWSNESYYAGVEVHSDSQPSSSSATISGDSFTWTFSSIDSGTSRDENPPDEEFRIVPSDGMSWIDLHADEQSDRYSYGCNLDQEGESPIGWIDRLGPVGGRTASCTFWNGTDIAFEPPVIA